MGIRKDKICGLLTVVMTAAFFISLLWGYGQYQQNKRALILLENEYQRAYYNYLAEVRDMALAAGKAYSSVNMQQAALLSRVHTLAEAAADHMSRLPIQQAQYQRSVAYLNQVGDYAASLTQKLARGESIDSWQRDNLGQVYGQLQKMYEQMSDMEQQVAAGTIVFAQAEGGWWQSARKALAGGKAVQGTAAAAEMNTADGYFSHVNALLEKVEPPDYTGKYSPGLSELPAQGLAGLKQISAEEAYKAADQFLALTKQPEAQLLTTEEIAFDTSLPMFSLVYTGQNGENIYIMISRAGGKIISYAYERPLGEARISAETALEKTQDLLRGAGYKDLRLVARQRLGDTLLLQYVPVQQGALCYPDSIYIKTALDNGEILVLNAQPYWRNNHQRVLPANGYDMEEAAALLGEKAQINGITTAYISNDAGGEIFCHELRHSIDGEEYLTYIGVESLLEEKILRGYTARDGSFYTH